MLRDAAAGDDEVGREVGERGEDEGAFVQARVRQGESRMVEGGVAVEQQIEVEGAGAPAFGSDATARFLNGEKGVEQIERRKGGEEAGDGVEIVLLAGRADGGGFVEGGDGVEAGAGQRGEGGEGGFEVRVTVAEIGAQGDVGGGRRRLVGGRGEGGQGGGGGMTNDQ